MTDQAIAVLMPVFNDWAGVPELLGRLHHSLVGEVAALTVVIVDDASTDPAGDAVAATAAELGCDLRVIRLRRNLGHQRAIAVGLAYLEEQLPGRPVVVMDGDGEDRPEDIPCLLARAATEPGTIVFAERTKRFDPIWFKLLYHIYRWLHRLLTGIPVRVGNFSLVPSDHLVSVVVLSELWSHYAAAVFRARLPRTAVPIARGRRISGRSRMSYAAMVNHGLSAISVFAEVVWLRLLLAALAALAGSGAAAAVVAAIVVRNGPAPIAVIGLVALGAAFALAFVVATVAGAMLLSELSARDRYSFVPSRDYRLFVLNIVSSPSAAADR